MSDCVSPMKINTSSTCGGRRIGHLQSANIRRAVPADITRIMTIRHAVRENRLSDPNSVTAVDCAAFIDRSEIWVWVEEGLIQGFGAGDVRDGCIWALFVAP